MKTVSFKLGCFALVVLVQILVPLQMTQTREKVLQRGTLYKFRANPVDPYDAYRGRYVSLGFGTESIEHPKGVQLPTTRQEGYVVVRPDDAGFAVVEDVVLQRPSSGDYFKARVYGGRDQQVWMEYPFTRFYMEEDAAPRAEQAYRQGRRDNRAEAYITVRIHAGQAVIEDLFVDDIPIHEYLRQNPDSRAQP